jgi:hypothetical protein
MQTQSPFPGMDPFLEERTKWSGVHARLIVAISDQLAEKVAPAFYVDIEQRVYIVSPDDPHERQQIVPDVYLIKEQQTQYAQPAASTIVTPTLVELGYDLEIRDRYLQIRDAENHEVITTIELLSPFNKTIGAQGYEAFQQNRRQVMASKTHWLEVDLLRAGERPAEVMGQSDYYVLLKRGDKAGPFEVWYFGLRDGMPTVAVPLRPPFDDVALDLQAAFADIYQRARYGWQIDYTRPVPPPVLRTADHTWVQECLKAWQQAAPQADS